jgi:hypothetical protein
MTVSDVVVIAAGILTIINLVDKVANIFKQVNSPTEARLTSIEATLIRIDQQISNHDKTLEAHAGFFDNDKRRLDLLETGSRVTSKALLALLGHANAGNNYDEMREAEKELRDYLIAR